MPNPRRTALQNRGPTDGRRLAVRPAARDVAGRQATPSAHTVDQLLTRAVELMRLARHREARECLLQAESVGITEAAQHLACARMFVSLRDPLAAERHALLAVEGAPESAKAHRALGRAYRLVKRYPDSAAALQRSVALDPLDVGAWLDLGEAHLATWALADAMRAFMKAAALAPDAADPQVGIAQCLTRAGHPQRAIRHLTQVVSGPQATPEAMLALAVIHRDVGELEAAQRHFERAIAARPSWHFARYSLGRLAFEQGDFPRAWALMAARAHEPGRGAAVWRAARPEWQGAQQGGPLLLYGEQGIGEEVLFASMLPEVVALPRQKIVVVNGRLIPLFERTLASPGLTFIDDAGPKVPASAYTEQIALGDLGAHIRTRLGDFLAARAPYLRADPQRVAHYAARLRASPAPRVCGLTWRSRNALIAEEKSLRGQDLEALTTGLNCRFLNLQYGEVPNEIASLRQLGVDLAVLEDLDLRNDLDGLAAAIMACDLVVTTSNSTAHIAGALGKRTLLLLPHGRGRFWYWQAQGEGSLWYPSVRILRQTRAGDWSAPIAEARRLMEAPDA
jgi:Flp pilus assembly protein TadD